MNESLRNKSVTDALADAGALTDDGVKASEASGAREAGDARKNLQEMQEIVYSGRRKRISCYCYEE